MSVCDQAYMCKKFEQYENSIGYKKSQLLKYQILRFLPFWRQGKKLLMCTNVFLRILPSGLDFRDYQNPTTSRIFCRENVLRGGLFGEVGGRTLLTAS